MKKKLSVRSALKNENGDQKLFNYLFNRTLELCSYHYLDVENAKKQFEEKLLNFDINSYDDYLNEFMHYLSKKDDDKNNQKFCLLFNDAVSLMETAYKYCYENGNTPSPYFDQLIGINKPKHRIGIESVLIHLASLERLATSYNAGTVTTYWLNQQIKNRQKQHARGGKTKAINKRNIEQPLKEKAIEMYKNLHPMLKRKWKNRAEFVTYFLNIENPKRDAEDLISDATVKRWIREYLNSSR